MTETFQNVCRKFVETHVIHSANTLVYELTQIQEHLSYEDQEILMNLSVRRDYEEGATDAGWEEAEPYWVFEGDGVKLLPSGSFSEEDAWVKICELEQIALVDEDGEQIDPQEAAEDEGWTLLDEVTFILAEDGETSEAEDWEELCREQDIEPYEQEVYEFWVVDERLSRLLSDQGEVVRSFMGFDIWGRTTTGQAIWIDGVIEQIVREIEDERAKYQ